MSLQAGPLAHHAHPSPNGPPLNGNDLLGRLPGLMGALDWLGIAGSGLVAQQLSVVLVPASSLQTTSVLLAATLTVNYLHLAHAYGVRSIVHTAAQVTKVPLAWLGTIMTLSVIESLSGFSGSAFDAITQIWYATALLPLLGVRCAVHWLLSRWRVQGRLARRVAVLGSGPAAAQLAVRLSRAKDMVLVGLFTDGETSTAGHVAGNVENLLSMAAAQEIDEVILASAWSSTTALSATIAKFAPLQTEIKLDPGLTALSLVPREVGFVADVPILTLQRRPLQGWGAPLKRLADLVLSSLLLVMLAPIFLLIAVLIKLDTRGSILFRQERWGFNSNRFVVYKFRSMHEDCGTDPNVPQARRNDPRVTRIGAFLRRTSLDELPQLINVLEGTMALVGPRPHAAAHNEKYAKIIDGYLSRHRMKPGITGWAQINGARGETENPQQMQRRVEFDLSYIANWSLLLDLKVLVMTIPVVLRGTNAH
jgi:putative colanic acid biosynthesis UDP-glucose lipid carrier transferase